MKNTFHSPLYIYIPFFWRDNTNSLHSNITTSISKDDHLKWRKTNPWQSHMLRLKSKVRCLNIYRLSHYCLNIIFRLKSRVKCVWIFLFPYTLMPQFSWNNIIEKTKHICCKLNCCFKIHLSHQLIHYTTCKKIS